ncbi:MAG TPA: hypothetical protein VMC09_09035 [Anaerolineales bacterium]|nr:hypothetical protein [Anaerolineales bacterium]
MDGFAYIPGDEPVKSPPLGRFLPAFPQGVATAFLAEHASPGGWVLDPLGATPHLAVEMARSGYRALVAVNNPVGRFLLERAANPSSPADLRAALSELAAARKGDERLEIHLQSLYLTECVKCQRQVPAEAFVWERASGALVARIYHCSCGEGGEFPATEADIARAASLAATDGLHRARALERVTTPDDPDRRHVEEALECYLPRAVYALITIINKLDGLSIPLERRKDLLTLVLTACDEASALWPYPAERPRPKQLTLPTRFLEKNVWSALERSVELWSDEEAPVQLVNWPEVPGEAGGICLFEGPVRDLAPRLKELSLAAILTVVPRPNQAFWTLSALWAGWLWGRGAAAPFKAALRRRRYDWNWHAAALYAALKNLSDRLPLNAPLFAIIPEVEPAFLSAALLAAAGAGFDLSGLALRTRHDPAQVLWHRRAFAHEEKEPAEIDTAAVQQAMQTCLRERGEPLPYLTLHVAGLEAMAADRSLRWREEALSQLHAPIQDALANPAFVHLSESSNPEVGLWGLADWPAEVESLPDRVEVAIVRFLQKNPDCLLRDLESALDRDFQGLDTPSLGLVHAVLASYASAVDGRWNIRPQDSPAARRTDLETAAQVLSGLASRLGYTCLREESPQRMVLWQEAGQAVYAFHLVASALTSRLLRGNPYPADKSVLVLPGGRAGLLAYKLDRDPVLYSLAEPWRLVKFRHLRRLTELTTLNRDRFAKELSNDPIEAPEQMKLF